MVRKLRNHPSIALWSGDNEVDDAYYFRGLDPAHNVLTREVLPQVVFQCDPYRSFLPSSPYMSPETVAAKNLQLMPEMHLWNTRDYFKSAYYTEHPAILSAKSVLTAARASPGSSASSTKRTCGPGKTIRCGLSTPPARWGMTTRTSFWPGN